MALYGTPTLIPGLVEDLLWSVPKESKLNRLPSRLFPTVLVSVQEPSLVDFWQANFKVQVEARSGLLVIHTGPDPPVKKRKKLSPIQEDEANMV